MKTFILIMLFWDASHGGSAIGTPEFADKQACEQALAASHKAMDASLGRSGVYGVCVPKSSDAAGRP